MVVRGGSIQSAFSLVGLECQTCDRKESILSTALDQVLIPKLESAAALVVHVYEEYRVIVCGIQTFAAKLTYAGTLNCKDIADIER